MSQMSEQAIEVPGGLDGCFASLDVSSGSRAEVMKKGCLSNWKERIALVGDLKNRRPYF